MPKYHKIIAQLKRKEVSNRQIAEMLGISRNTVNSTVNAIIRSGKSFYEVSLMTEDELNDVLRSMSNSSSRSSRESDYVMPDYERLKKELVKPGVTLQLLWEEYMDQCRLSGKKGYQLTQFKKHFNDALKKQNSKIFSSTEPENRSKLTGPVTVPTGRILIPAKSYTAGCSAESCRSAVSVMFRLRRI